MKNVQIKCNTNGEISLDYNAKTNGISIALVDGQQLPVARYEFSSDKVSRLTKLLYDATNVKIYFFGDITPTMISEITSI